MAAGISKLPSGEPRQFSSLGDAARTFAGVARVSLPLVRVYRGSIEPDLRERVMVAVSEANACAGCSRVHQRWATRTGVSERELEALGLGDLARLDERSRAAVVYAVDRSQARFSGEPSPEILEVTANWFGPGELFEIEAVARAMTLANLTVSSLARIRSRLTPSEFRPGSSPAGRRNGARGGRRRRG